MFDISLLEPLPVTRRLVVPEDYIDPMGHMNVRHYMALFDDAFWTFFDSFGLNVDYWKAHNSGGFALKCFIQYMAEVRVAESLAVRSRFIARGERRYHFMHFLVNETMGNLASTFEILGSYADMTIRRTAPIPQEIAERIDVIVAEHDSLGWDPPLCGQFSV